MVKVKICGITSRDDALIACDAGADALGFNFVAEARKRNRYITPDDAEMIIRQLPPFVTSVAVVANETPERLQEYLEFVDCLQLHGDEPPEIYASFSHRIIKAVRITEDFQPETLQRHPASAYLVDSYVPHALGGSGVSCDWQKAREIASMYRYVILAGGLTPENVQQAIHIVQPYGVDTASGVESAPGKKDPEKMRRFIRAAKA